MSLFRSFLLGLMLLLFSPFQADAQWGWQSGQYYQYQGQWIKEYDNYYVMYYPNGYQKRFRILQWERRSYSGYVYVWNGYSWAYQWQSSWAWYCIWGPWNYEFFSYR